MKPNIAHTAFMCCIHFPYGCHGELLHGFGTVAGQACFRGINDQQINDG
ncbi:MAG: hypothetical protein ACFHW5_04315 [Verrucomicrobiota bacterium]